MSNLQWTIEHKFLTHFMSRTDFNIITRLKCIPINNVLLLI